MPDAFYSLDGSRIVASELTRGPWDPGSQHAGPPSALLARALERCEPREGARIARVTVEILAPVPIAPMTVSARVVRPGRSVELIEASLEGADGELMRARGWRLAEGETEAEWEREQPPPGREDAEALEFFPDKRGLARTARSRVGETTGWHTAMEIVFARGRFLEPGPGVAWMRPRVPLVEGEAITPLQRTMLAADAGNGISAPLDWQTHIFMNTDLTVHLLRPPRGEWICLDSVTHVDGVGMTDTALWDDEGRIGRAVQTLLVRARA